ncbi:putative NAD kinase (polyphosphate/ATP) [Natrialba magadii ATCC 43099]|uniref:ATP-NAD/AcoX kinase n=1 Tax=Natrialba magadii (strain ATCC 43099 / DSM 3394 / CCM 3739 / CIP 104546 / IAM 13178 / JCM 8861 / NBRC 102185 / NCIMB 2190 / MS3) TaxID=547559 RepID=D3SS15_NATMM|nr:NAD(+)/NADH kinase [Natrialba magadii]ADD06789.1 putative NAD kinase (polyphosphate/ATP) [Natrialba magadii ATCC 43099]ELY27775.1 ATP-NAD/AcoX kinase [Natrialba magadii ATCC 43099]
MSDRDDGVQPDHDEPVVGVVDPTDSISTPTVDGDAREVADTGVDGSALESTLFTHDATLAVDTEAAPVLNVNPAVVVAVGESALAEAARESVTGDEQPPILPVGSIPGLSTVAEESLPDALATVLAGEAEITRCERPVLECTATLVDGTETTVRALFDLTLAAAEPAAISEFSVRSREESVGSVRADGIVVATALGTHGYASALESPRLSPAVDAVSVVPISPFSTNARQWVLPPDEAVLTVDREEQSVALIADDRSVGHVAIETPLTVSVVGTVPILCVPAAAA